MRKIIEVLYNNRNKIAAGVVLALTMLASIFSITSCQLEAEKLKCSINGKCL